MFRLVVRKIQLLEERSTDKLNENEEVNDIIRLHHQALEYENIEINQQTIITYLISRIDA